MHVVASPNITAGPLRKIALLGSHAPRQCGIATFTTDLGRALASQAPETDCLVLAMNDPGRKHAYAENVRFEIAENDTASYLRAADFLNVNSVDVLSVQHEYGIFGGRAGSHVLLLLRELRMPIVTTLHTILADPSAVQRAAMDELTRLSERLVVMSDDGASLLSRVYGVSHHKIDLIPHGTPMLPPRSRSKDRLGVEGNKVILTFGLLSPDKGIEYVIDALPEVRARHPEVTYIVLGATHPHVKERHGEIYRLMLEERARARGVDANVIFHNRFVNDEELGEFLSSADVYVTPYLKAEQITSGTLAYAVGCGKAVISTPYRYARELLSEDRGVLVPAKDSGALAREIVALFDDEPRRLAMGERAAAYGRGMTWPAVSLRYVQSFERARREHAERRRIGFQAKTLARRIGELPEMNLEHLALMTDDTGLLQHAAFNVPRYGDGYCLDDNARALAAMVLVEDAGTDDRKLVRRLASRYLAFLRHAFNEERGRFRNFMTYGRDFTEQVGSEDCHGRALWALGTVVGRANDPGMRSLGRELFHAALPAARALRSPRAVAFSLLGIDEYLRAFEGDTSVQASRESLSHGLLEQLRATSAPGWPWFEDRLTYCNARLPHALIASGARMKSDAMLAEGLEALAWLLGEQRSREGYFAPVGSNGFHVRGGPRAAFDQQPVEAAATVSACAEAWRVTGERDWMTSARQAFQWFLGQNQLQQPLYDPETGGCRDGLHEDRVNENQGAESTLSFLLALLEMRTTDRITILSARSALRA